MQTTEMDMQIACWSRFVWARFEANRYERLHEHLVFTIGGRKPTIMEKQNLENLEKYAQIHNNEVKKLMLIFHNVDEPSSSLVSRLRQEGYVSCHWKCGTNRDEQLLLPNLEKIPKDLPTGPVGSSG